MFVLSSSLAVTLAIPLATSHLSITVCSFDHHLHRRHQQTRSFAHHCRRLHHPPFSQHKTKTSLIRTRITKSPFRIFSRLVPNCTCILKASGGTALLYSRLVLYLSYLRNRYHVQWYDHRELEKTQGGRVSGIK